MTSLSSGNSEPAAAYLSLAGGGYTAFLGFTASADVSAASHLLLIAAGALLALCGFMFYRDRRHSVAWSVPALIVSASALYGLYVIYNYTFVCCLNIFVLVALGPILGLIAGFLGLAFGRTPLSPAR